MNSKSTWIWLTMAAVLFAAVLGVQKYGHKPPPPLVPLLPEFKATEVTGVQFTPADQLEIRAVRTNGIWELTKPVVYPAQSASIDTLLQALQVLAPAHTIPPGEMRKHKNADTEYGFDQRTTLTLYSGEESRQLVIGALTAPGDQLYVQVVGTEGVFVVDARLLQLLPTRAEDWRDTGLVDLRHLAFDRISISNATAVLQLQQESSNSLWRLTYPMTARADNLRLLQSLQRLHTTRVVEFVTDNPRSDMESFGLNAPELEITLAKGTNVVTTLQFGKSPTNDATLVYARRAGFNTVVTVEQQGLEPWLAPLDKFRDPNLVTRQRPVDQIEVSGVEDYVLQRVSSNAWELVDSELPVDAGFVGQFLITLVTAPIVEFKDSITEADLAKYGLAEPTRRIVLRGKPTGAFTNAIIADLAFGDVKEGLIYARRADENPVYAIRLQDYALLAAAPWQLRDRSIWRFSETNVVRVIVTEGDRKIEVRRAGLNAWGFVAGSQGTLNGAAVEETVARFGALDALAWVGRGEDQRAKFGFAPDGLTVTIEMKDGSQHQIEFGGKTPDNYPYAVVALGGQPWFFECPLVVYELLKFSLLNPASPP